MTITFIPLATSHFLLLLKWLESPHIKAWWDQEIQWTPSLIQEKYGDYAKGQKLETGVIKAIHAYIIYVDNTPIGYIQLYNAYDFGRSKPLVDLPANLAAFDVFIGEIDYTNRGIGSKAIDQFLKEYASSYTHVFVDAESTNLAAIRAYEKAGFKKVKEQLDIGEVWMLREQSQEKTMNLHFEKANLSHINIIFSWLAEPHVQEFWDKTQAHKDDILNFVKGRKEPSMYCGGKYVYWIASHEGHPFALLMTIKEIAEDNINSIKATYLSSTGHTYGVDYMIGDKNYVGKGCGAKTLRAFLDFFIKNFDPKTDTFLIDPASDNPKAKHVYMKAGFESVTDFVMTGDVSGAGKLHHLLVRSFGLNG